MAKQYIQQGHTVVGCGRRADIIEALAKEYAGTDSSFHTVDVSKEAEVAAFAQKIDARYGDVDVLVCNAGLGPAGKAAWELPAQHIHSIVDVSLKGVMFANTHIVPIMLRGLDRLPSTAPPKRVINISSGIAHTSMPWAADYCAVKCGVEGYSKCVAQGFKELAKSRPAWKDRILCVPFAPGVVATEMNKQKGLPSADAWAKEASVYLLEIPACENGSSLTLPGYYSKEYQATWIVPAGARMNPTWVKPTPW